MFDNIGQVVNYCDSQKSSLTFVSYNALWIGISRLRRSSFTMEIEFSNSHSIVPIIEPTPRPTTSTSTSVTSTTSTFTSITSTTTTSTASCITTSTVTSTTTKITTISYEIDPTPPIMTTTPIATTNPNNNTVLCGVPAIKPDETGLKIVGGSIAVPHRFLNSIIYYLNLQKSKMIFFKAGLGKLV